MLFQPASNIQVPFMQPQFQRGRASAGGGAAAWFDDMDPLDANNNENVAEAIGYFPEIPLPSGNVTKLRFFTVGAALTTAVKMALYDSGKTLLSYGEQIFTSQPAGWCEVAITPVTITAANYFIGLRSAASLVGTNIPIRDGTGTMYYTLSGSYADFPDDPFSPAGTLARDYAMGAYIS